MPNRIAAVDTDQWNLDGWYLDPDDLPSVCLHILCPTRALEDSDYCYAHRYPPARTSTRAVRIYR
jgi:hypothetical protein